MPTPSKHLVVPAPKDKPHLPKKVYFNCCHRLKDREAERQRSPIVIGARLNDSRMRVLGNKSPIGRVQGGLESMAESDHEYVPFTNQESSYHSATPTQYSEVNSIRSQRHSEDYGSDEIPIRDPIIRLLI
ncbi:unnamed protein product [Prunus brigantina]